VIVEPDEDQHRFCFIEKNRLDDFTRIAARTPGDQRQLIATLFGVDQFSEFVRGFNPTLDQDLTLTGPQAWQLAQRRIQLANSEQTIAEYPEKIARVEVQEQALATRMTPGQTYQVCIDWLLGTPAQVGRLLHVQTQLDAIPPAVHDVTPSRLQGLLADSRRDQDLWIAASARLASRAGEVSYTKLYEAVLALADGAAACPACGTALAAVAQDPFVKARAGLEELAQLGVLQQEEKALRAQLNEAVRALADGMRRGVAIAALLRPLEVNGAGLPPRPPATRPFTGYPSAYWSPVFHRHPLALSTPATRSSLPGDQCNNPRHAAAIHTPPRGSGRSSARNQSPTAPVLPRASANSMPPSPLM